jgi:Na+-transporting NADH:ubiquinone oxidoreductase subunit NqrC
MNAIWQARLGVVSTHHTIRPKQQQIILPVLDQGLTALIHAIMANKTDHNYTQTFTGRILCAIYPQ